MTEQPQNEGTEGTESTESTEPQGDAEQSAGTTVNAEQAVVNNAPDGGGTDGDVQKGAE